MKHRNEGVLALRDAASLHAQENAVLWRCVAALRVLAGTMLVLFVVYAVRSR